MERHFGRRDVLAGAAGTFAVTGCLGSEDPSTETPADADGDGVPDASDYAPRDPSVQARSDLATKTTTLRPTTTSATSTPTITATATTRATATPTTRRVATATSTTTVTTTRNAGTNAIRVTDDYWSGTSGIREYGAGHVTVEMVPDVPEADYDAAKVYVAAAVYPRQETVAEVTTGTFQRSDGTQSFTLNLDLASAPTGERLQYVALLLPADGSVETTDPSRISTIMETDPFILGPDRRTVERSSHPEAVLDDEGQGYSRNAVEGAYNLEVEGRTSGRRWTVNFFAYKSAYVEAVGRSRGRSRPEYVSYELTQGSARTLAQILDEAAEANEFTGTYEKVEFVIDFVQRLPYVPDDVGKGFDDYTKFVLETLVELGGDCEDTSILLASILEAEPFGYDTVLIQPEGHMAVGIWQEEPAGYYYEYEGRTYSFIETTGEGWGIGDVPTEYQGEQAYIHQV